jgi:hypothetical protein
MRVTFSPGITSADKMFLSSYMNGTILNPGNRIEFQIRKHVMSLNGNEQAKEPREGRQTEAV